MSADESITSLPEAVAALGALPMPVPVGPEPQRVCSLCGVVKPDGATMRNHVLNVHPDEFCGLYHEQPCRHGAVGPEPLTAEREAEIREWVEAMGRKRDIRYYGSWQQHGELLGEIDRLRAERAAIGNEIARFGIFGAALPAAKALVKRADELVTENAGLRARVAELERTVEQMCDGLNGHDCPPPGETPMEAVTRFAVRLMEAERLVAEDGCSCPPVDRTHQIGCPLDGVPASGPSERPADGLTKVFVPVASLREPEGEHYALVHHDYRVPHDLPETGGTR